MSQELIIFKKDTDAVGTNRGFVYQYLKTLIQWLSNYQNGIDNLIYCEVEDDIKQINRARTTIQWTQIKCYSSVFNLSHSDIIKSLYNFFVLFVGYNGYDGNFTFETNSRVSGKDDLLKEWIRSQPLTEHDVELLAKVVVKIQRILSVIAEETKNSLMKGIATKIGTLEAKKSSATKQKNKRLLIELKNELQTTELLAKGLEEKISDIETVSDFIRKIKWTFDDIRSEESVHKLKAKAIQLLKQIIKSKISIELYFNRLISEIFFKSIESDIEDRCLDNELLAEILSETEVQIKENTNQEFMDKFNGLEEALAVGFGHVNAKLDTLEYKIDSIKEMAAAKMDIPLIDLPMAEIEDVENILLKEPEKQSKLVTKIEMINIKDPEQQENLINLATELRCRYLLFLQKLKFENLHNKYEALKSLESKVKRHCTNTVINNDAETEIFSPREFWNAFQEDLKLLLKDLKVRNKVDIDEDVVFAQMYQMAAECHLRWHKKDEVYE